MVAAYTVCIGDLNGKALEEPLVDPVEELLLFRKVRDCFSGALDGDVEMFESFGEIVTVKALRD